MNRPRIQPLRRAILAVAPLLLAACSTEAPAGAGLADPAESPAAAAPVTLTAGDFRLHTEPVTRIRFPVLASGVSVDARHFDPTLPAHKFRHSIRLGTEAGTVVLIDIWDNPQHLALRPWFDAHLAFLVDGNTQVSERPMSRSDVTGILLHQPRSPQALSQAIAVFASGDQVFRVTCIDDEGNAAARRLFEQVVDQIETGVTP